MKKRNLFISFFVTALIVLLISGIAIAAPENPPVRGAPPEIGDEGVPPTPGKDPCLHCHISGEYTKMWIPLARWVVFGTAGVIMVFGIVRSVSVWRQRAPWQPVMERIAAWVDERYEISDPLSKVLHKPVPAWQRRWWYCLGGLSAFLFVVQAVTGVMLAFYYKPTPDAAYASIQFIENEVHFGAAVRMIHHWVANGMVLMVIAHMLRVFISGAFKPPRELNWISGVVLFLVTLGFGSTGIFLRVGWNVSHLTLIRSYALHVLVFPLIIVAVMGAHFIMVRRQGIHKPL